jgi:hypothetical protein
LIGNAIRRRVYRPSGFASGETLRTGIRSTVALSGAVLRSSPEGFKGGRDGRSDGPESTDRIGQCVSESLGPSFDLRNSIAYRAGFKLYWTWISRRRMSVGRRPTSKELRELIFRMVAENSTWGAPRIRGELKMLGFQISERTVLNWMRKAPRIPEPGRRWATFLAYHREAIAAMDFFTVPTLTFGVLYFFFVIARDRRRIVHFNATRHPSSAWVSQQLREAFPYDSSPKYLIHDQDAIFGTEVVDTIEALEVKSKRTAFKSPWQNGIAERFLGSCRRDLLDHVIVLNERHLKRLMAEYVRYHHDDRTHLGLDKQTPAGRVAAVETMMSAKIISMPRLGGLHHRYDLAA